MYHVLTISRWPSKVFHIIFIIMISGLLMTSCSDSDGNGNGNGGTSNSITMTDAFPLSSGWVTDNWTLFVDYRDHEIQGVKTRAMVDMKEPVVYYWTNDDNGLFLHAVKDIEESGLTLIPKNPIKIAEPVMEIGDVVEGTIEIEIPDDATGKLELNIWDYSVNLVDIESVIVTAGKFDGCGKFEMKSWASNSSSDSAPVETFWLCEGVGFTKGENQPYPTDDGSVIPISLELFTETGKTRNLISYHLTPNVEDPDVVAVKDKWSEVVQLFEEERLNDILSTMDEGYYDRRCRDKAAAEDDWKLFFEDSQEYVGYGTIEEVTFNQDSTIAFVQREYLDSYWWYRNDPNGVRDHAWNRIIAKYKKNNGVWQGYGSQTELTPNFAWAMVYIRKVPGENPYLATSSGLYNCADNSVINTTDAVSSYTITGPPGSGINALNLKQNWDPVYEEFFTQIPLSEISNPSGLYTFEVVDQNQNSHMFTRYLGKPIILPEPYLVNAIDNGTEIFFTWGWDWDPDQLDLESERIRYRIEVYDQNWNRKWQHYINEPFNMNYTARLSDHPELNELSSGSYIWRVRVRYYGKFGGYSQMISENRTTPGELVIN